MEQINKGFPHRFSIVCTYLCMCMCPFSFFFCHWMGARVRTTAQLVCSGPHTHTGADTHTHRSRRLQQPSALETQRGKEAESRNWQEDRLRAGSRSVRLVHCCCQNSIFFNKLGRTGHCSLTQSVRQLPQLKRHQQQSTETSLHFAGWCFFCFCAADDHIMSRSGCWPTCHLCPLSWNVISEVKTPANTSDICDTRPVHVAPHIFFVYCLMWVEIKVETIKIPNYKKSEVQSYISAKVQRDSQASTNVCRGTSI